MHTPATNSKQRPHNKRAATPTIRVPAGTKASRTQRLAAPAVSTHDDPTHNRSERHRRLAHRHGRPSRAGEKIPEPSKSKLPHQRGAVGGSKRLVIHFVQVSTDGRPHQAAPSTEQRSSSLLPTAPGSLQRPKPERGQRMQQEHNPNRTAGNSDAANNHARAQRRDVPHHKQ